MSKQVSLTACIAKMYEGGTLDRAGGTRTDSPMKKPSTSLSAMDNKLNLLDAKVEKILKSQGEVLKKLEVVYQGIGNLENGIAKLKPAKEPPSTAEDILKKGEPTLYNEIKALCTESVNLLKSLQQETNKQREKIDGIERSVSTADKVITFIGETFKSSKIVAYILKGTVPWRKGSLLENIEEKKETGAKPRAEFCNRAIQAEIRRSPEDDTGVKKQPTKTDERVNSTLQSQSDNQVDESPLAPITSSEVLAEAKNSEPSIASTKHTAENKPSRKPKEVTIKSREPTRTQTFIKETHDVGVNTDDHDASDCQKEEVTITVITGETQTPAPAAKLELNEATASPLDRHPDITHDIPGELQRKPSLAEQGAHSTTQQQEEAALKSSKNDVKGAKKPKAEKKEVCKSSKSAIPLTKNKDTGSEKDLDVPVIPLKGTPPDKTQNEQKTQASEAQNTDNDSVKKNKAEKLSKTESPNKSVDPVQQTQPDKKTSATETIVALETKAVETSDTKSVVNANPQKALRVIIDDSPSQPAPFEHRIVSARHMAVTSHYSLIQNELLGGGRFGQVHKCAELSSGLMLAAKIIQVKGSKDRDEVKNEIGVMNQLNHVNLIQLYDAFESKNNLTLIMEYIGGGELFDRIIDNYQLTELDAIVFTKQICEGVQYLHQQYILHLDLKPENILCVNRTGNQIKIIDFGLARRYRPRDKLKVNFGTPEFLAPEVVNYDFVSFPTDMWSVGVITYMLLSGMSPFLGDNDTDTMNNILHGNCEFDSDSFENVSAEAKDFISRLLVSEKCSRMSATGCLKHDWLNNLAEKAKRCQVLLKSQIRLQSYLAHRQWKKHFYVVAAANRLKRIHQRGSVNPA
ncbi:myosin light chain kinase 3-like isoform X1 [Acipenser oxyrinchus oxyrinchus]|uniref:Myosin light chain kinase 3-like isoform X1 n=1 Tax=Acipenser oxyrinchus oxyrinchus TaxID=40147 RepID=A0AAD8G3B7_ACIOX|nr:myosin light chain kinase 3-like isoform X1 [Acipenser oxyrinchus oxyrinchus]